MKKAKTRIISLLLAAIILCSFAACGKQGTDVSETTAKPEETTAESSVQTESLKATDEDFEKLKDTVGIIKIVFSDDGEYIFNSESETALANAMQRMLNEDIPMFSEILKTYGIKPDCKSFNTFYLSDLTDNVTYSGKDPLDKFGDKPYCKLNADQVDWILENVLCVTPDRTKTDDDYKSVISDGDLFDYYYYDGYYYYAVETGDGGGDYPEIIDYSEQPDGSYIVKLSTEDKDSEDKDDYEILEASASLKDIDGERVWAVSYLKVLEHIDVEN